MSGNNCYACKVTIIIGEKANVWNGNYKNLSRQAIFTPTR